MIPRAIILGGSGDQSLQDFAFTWAFEFGTSEMTLRGLIDAGRAAEWRQRLGSMAKARPFSSNKDALDRLKEGNPADLIDLDIDEESGEQRQLLQELQGIAKEVQARQTIFCLGSLGTKEAEKKAILKALGQIAKDIAALSADQLCRQEFSFAPLRKNIESQEAIMEFAGLVIRAGTSSPPEGLDWRKGPVLLVGPTGAGKTELAGHMERGDDDQPLHVVKINIGAVSENVLESRMRGYRKGAFTDAKEDTPGWFERANGGILFLDEFQNASLSVQVQLLDLLSAVSNRVKVARFGDDANPRLFEVRVVLAANEPLNVLLDNNRLRHDLFHRVRIVHELPSLSERLRGPGKEIGLLERLISLYRWKSNLPAQDPGRERDFSLYFPMLDPKILAQLEMHTWPGSLRELERVCFDLNGKRETSRKPDADFIRQQLQRVPIRNTSEVVRSPPPASTELARLRRLETILMEKNLDFRDASVALGEVRLSTRRHLVNFLLKHKDSLSSEFANHPLAGKFLSPPQRKSG